MSMITTEGTSTGTRTTSIDHFQPGDGLERTSRGWLAARSRVEFTSETVLTPGWHTLRWRMRSRDTETRWRRAELVIERPDGTSIFQKVVGWSGRLKEFHTFDSPGGEAIVRLTISHATGQFEIPRLDIEPVRGPRLAMVAIREKVRLLRSYNCFGRALRRGGRMLIRGQFLSIGRKLMSGLADSQTLPPTPTFIPIAEVNGTVWRRHELDECERNRLIQQCEQTTPDVMPIILPVDEEHKHFARMAVLSIRRQIDPHWQLYVVGSGPNELLNEVKEFTSHDPRIELIWSSQRDGLSSALARAVATIRGDIVAVCSPRLEWREDALMLARSEGAGSIAIIRTDRFPESLPSSLSPSDMSEWLDGEERNRGLTSPARQITFDMYVPVPAAKQDLLVSADFAGVSGWGSVVDAVLRGMPALNVRCWRHPRSRVRLELLPPSVAPDIRHRKTGDNQLVIAPPYMLDRYSPDRDTALFTMWETDGLKTEDVKRLNRCGLVMVPSAWNVETFRTAGVTVPMSVVPLGFDSHTFTPGTPMPELCTFGSAGNLTVGGIRKNVQRVVDLFRQAFPTESDVRLHIKLSPDSPLVETGNDPRIHVVNKLLKPGELAEWYRSLTAFVNGSFGEGFGLHLIEAMGCGRPLITANYSGLTAYFSPELGYVVGHELQPVANDIYVGRWAVPNEADIVRAMRDVYENPQKAAELGLQSAEQARAYSWERMVGSIKDELEQHHFL